MRVYETEDSKTGVGRPCLSDFGSCLSVPYRGLVLRPSFPFRSRRKRPQSPVGTSCDTLNPVVRVECRSGQTESSRPENLLRTPTHPPLRRSNPTETGTDRTGRADGRVVSRPHRPRTNFTKHFYNLF